MYLASGVMAMTTEKLDIYIWKFCMNVVCSHDKTFWRVICLDKKVVLWFSTLFSAFWRDFSYIKF
jgi:hypothetical protein